EPRRLLGEPLRHARHAQLDYLDLALDRRMSDPVVEAPPLERVVELSRPVGGEDHVRPLPRLDRAELRDRHLEVREHLEQERLELLVGPVDLVDQEQRPPLGLERFEHGSADQELAAEQLRLVHRAGLGCAYVQELAGVVPLVHRVRDVEALVALQPDERRAERRRERLRGLGLPDSGLAFEEERLLEGEREVERRREPAVGQVQRPGERGLELGDRLVRHPPTVPSCRVGPRAGDARRARADPAHDEPARILSARDRRPGRSARGLPGLRARRPSRTEPTLAAVTVSSHWSDQGTGLAKPSPKRPGTPFRAGILRAAVDNTRPAARWSGQIATHARWRRRPVRAPRSPRLAARDPRLAAPRDAAADTTAAWATATGSRAASRSSRAGRAGSAPRPSSDCARAGPTCTCTTSPTATTCATRAHSRPRSSGCRASTCSSAPPASAATRSTPRRSPTTNGAGCTRSTSTASSTRTAPRCRR